MLSTKIKRFLYHYAQNSRFSTTELSKLLRTSQQSIHYLIGSFRKKRVILNYNAVIDPAKFGYIDLVVFFDYVDFSSKTIRDILSFLKLLDYVVSIEEVGQGFDLKVTFCVPNLSLFNKLMRDFLQRFKNKIISLEAFPVVVKHLYTKDYLVRKKKYEDMVICGDRDVATLSSQERFLLQALWKDPTQTIVSLHSKTKLNPKTIIKIKKRLESNKVVRCYGVILDYDLLEIERRTLLLSSEELSLAEDKKLLQFAKTHQNIVSLTRLIGTYDIMIELEGENLTKKDVLKELRTEFGFRKYKLLSSGFIHKEKYVPEAALL